MSVKYRLAALLLALAAVVGILGLSRVSADEIEIYLLAENDVMADLPVEAMPAWIGGALYIPYTAFDWTVTKVNLGVSYGMIREGEEYLLTLYSLNDILTFDLNRGTCVDRRGNPQNMRAVYRNGYVFVPAAAVCSFFDLGYTYTPTNYGTLIRITNGQQRLGSEFVQYAEGSMRERYNRYLKQLSPPTPVVTATPKVTATPQPSATATQTPVNTPRPSTQPRPTPSPTPTPNGDEDEDDDPEELIVYLSFLCTGGGDLDGILEQLSISNVGALFLFRPSELEDYGEQLRQISGSGHQIGFILASDTLGEARKELELGGTLLARLAHTTSHTVYLENGGSELAAGLTEEGWAWWTGQARQLEDTRSAYNRCNALLASLEGFHGTVRVLLDDGAGTADTLARLLPRLPGENCQVRLPVETLF